MLVAAMQDLPPETPAGGDRFLLSGTPFLVASDPTLDRTDGKLLFGWRRSPLGTRPVALNLHATLLRPGRRPPLDYLMCLPNDRGC